MARRPSQAEPLIIAEERHVVDLLDELEAAVADLKLGVLDRSDPKPERWTKRGLSAVGLLRRTRVRTTDGFRASSGPNAGSHTSGPADPVGNAVVRGDRDELLDLWRQVIRGADTALVALHGSVGALARATPADPTNPPPLCRVCGQAPVHRAERCDWCYRWWLVHGSDVPEVILAARRDGRRITTALVAQALAPLTSSRRAGARR